MTNIGIRRDKLNEAIQHAGLVLRERAGAWLQLLNQHNVPCLVFSAGIGNIIEETLKHLQLLLPNLRTVSNFMNFDSQVMGRPCRIVYAVFLLLLDLYFCRVY